MAFNTIADIVDRFMQLNATHILFKILAPNDNTKQQIYFGGSFEVIRLLPYQNLHPYPGVKRPNFKADIDFSWIDEAGHVERAKNTKLILYPDYPEVRFSGFLSGCKIAPRHLLQPLSGQEREERADTPRVLFLGVADDSHVFGFLSSWGDHLAQEAIALRDSGEVHSVASVFFEHPLGSSLEPDNRSQLLHHLHGVYQQGWIEAFKLAKTGEHVPYPSSAPPQAGGYTLEGALGITPNGTPGPDLLGWEIKAHSHKNTRITLMTPEPKRGIYAGDFQRFMFDYGRLSTDGNRYDFTGTHKAGLTCKTSSLVMLLDGFDPTAEKILDPEGGLHIYDKHGNLVAGWSFTDLMDLWRKKHNRTVFVPYDKRLGASTCFSYGPIVTTAEGADFSQFLGAIANQLVFYDPGVKMVLEQRVAGDKWKPKKRNQIRSNLKNLDSIFNHVEKVDLSLLD